MAAGVYSKGFVSVGDETAAVLVAYELQRRVQASLSIYDSVYYFFTLPGEGAGGPWLYFAGCSDKDRLQVA